MIAGPFAVLSVPTLGLAVYHAQKILNQTIYQSYPDLAFITRKTGNNSVKIYQDVLRPDILKEMKGLSDVQKAGFLQLQAIVGLSKIGAEGTTIQTDSHGIVRKTLKKLERLGYLENYQETFFKKSRIILPKLAFGSTKKVSSKEDIYHIECQRTKKPMDITSNELQKMFPAIFSKRGGLFAVKPYVVQSSKTGELSIDFSKMQEAPKQDKAKEFRTKFAKTEETPEETIQQDQIEQKKDKTRER